MSRVLVCGSRDYNDAGRLEAVLTAVQSLEPIEWLIEGGARGADALARDWAKANGIRNATFVAEWDTYGKRAGIVRNQQMLDEARPDIVYAFTSKPLSQSKGTLHMVTIARKAGVRTIVVGEDDTDFVVAAAQDYVIQEEMF